MLNHPFKGLGKLIAGAHLSAATGAAEESDWLLACEEYRKAKSETSLNAQESRAASEAFYQYSKSRLASGATADAASLAAEAIIFGHCDPLVRVRETLMRRLLAREDEWRRGDRRSTPDQQLASWRRNGCLGSDIQPVSPGDSLHAVYCMGAYNPRSFSHARNTLSGSVGLLKQGDSECGVILGTLLGAFAKSQTDLVRQSDLIVPIPGEYSRESGRGINPPRTLAEGVGELLALPIFDDILYRTPSAHSREVDEETLSKSYHLGTRIGGSRLDGRVVLLLDDITTAGKTLRVCARLLRQAGISRVFGIALARTQRS